MDFLPSGNIIKTYESYENISIPFEGMMWSLTEGLKVDSRIFMGSVNKKYFLSFVYWQTLKHRGLLSELCE